MRTAFLLAVVGSIHLVETYCNFTAEQKSDSVLAVITACAFALCVMQDFTAIAASLRKDWK